MESCICVYKICTICTCIYTLFVRIYTRFQAMFLSNCLVFNKRRFLSANLERKHGFWSSFKAFVYNILIVYLYIQIHLVYD